MGYEEARMVRATSVRQMGRYPEPSEIAAAGKFLRWEAPKPRRVAYLDGEMPAEDLQERIKWLVRGAGEHGPETPGLEYLQILTPDLQTDWMPDLSTPEGQAALEPHLHNFNLVILDCVSTLCRSGIENEAESWLSLQEWSLGLRRRGLSVLFVHHARQGEVNAAIRLPEEFIDETADRRARDSAAAYLARLRSRLH